MFRLLFWTIQKFTKSAKQGKFSCWQYFSVFGGQLIHFLEVYCLVQTAANNKSIYAIWADRSKIVICSLFIFSFRLDEL